MITKRWGLERRGYAGAAADQAAPSGHRRDRGRFGARAAERGRAGGRADRSQHGAGPGAGAPGDAAHRRAGAGRLGAHRGRAALVPGPAAARHEAAQLRGRLRVADLPGARHALRAASDATVTPFAARRYLPGHPDTGKRLRITETAAEVVETHPATFAFQIIRRSVSHLAGRPVRAYPRHRPPAAAFINGTPEHQHRLRRRVLPGGRAALQLGGRRAGPAVPGRPRPVAGAARRRCSTPGCSGPARTRWRCGRPTAPGRP